MTGPGRSLPKRIQLSRAKGWRKPEGAIVVSRPSKWGNPFRVVRRVGTWGVLGGGEWSAGADHDWTKADAQQWAVERFRDRFGSPRSNYGRGAQIELAGHDLACWCPLDQPCHADVLLEIANGGDAGQETDVPATVNPCRGETNP